jgi:hypothetical protein
MDIDQEGAWGYCVKQSGGNRGPPSRRSDAERAYGAPVAGEHFEVAREVLIRHQRALRAIREHLLRRRAMGQQGRLRACHLTGPREKLDSRSASAQIGRVGKEELAGDCRMSEGVSSSGGHRTPSGSVCPVRSCNLSAPSTFEAKLRLSSSHPADNRQWFMRTTNGDLRGSLHLFRPRPHRTIPTPEAPYLCAL